MYSWRVRFCDCFMVVIQDLAQAQGKLWKRREEGKGVALFSSSLHFSYLEVEPQLHTAGLSDQNMHCTLMRSRKRSNCCFGTPRVIIGGPLYKDICFLPLFPPLDPEKYRNSMWLEKRNLERQMHRTAFVTTQQPASGQPHIASWPAHQQRTTGWYCSQKPMLAWP